MHKFHYVYYMFQRIIQHRRKASSIIFMFLPHANKMVINLLIFLSRCACVSVCLELERVCAQFVFKQKRQNGFQSNQICCRNEKSSKSFEMRIAICFRIDLPENIVELVECKRLDAAVNDSSFLT